MLEKLQNALELFHKPIFPNQVVTCKGMFIEETRC